MAWIGWDRKTTPCQQPIHLQGIAHIGDEHQVVPEDSCLQACHGNDERQQRYDDMFSPVDAHGNVV